MDIIKNPIIIGILAGTITYAYLTWNYEEKNKKRSKKNQKKKEVNLLIPLIVAVMGWFIAYAYFQYNNEENNGDIIVPNVTRARRQLPLPVTRVPGYRFTKDVISESSDPKSFSLLTNGVTIPPRLPDVMLEMY